jgi:hypothetical protein
MKIEDVALARLRSELLDTLWLKYPQALSLDQLEADVRVAYLTRLLMRQATPDWKGTAWLAGAIREQLAVLNSAGLVRSSTKGYMLTEKGETPTGIAPTTNPHQQAADRRYQQVRSRYDCFDYWKKVTEANQTLDASDPFMNASGAPPLTPCRPGSWAPTTPHHHQRQHDHLLRLLVRACLPGPRH